MVVPEGGGVPAVLVLHAWWGLNSFFKKFCERLAESGFVVLAPDLYHGEVTSTIIGAKRLRSTQRKPAVERELVGGVDYLRQAVATNEGRIGVLGFSMGANLALWLSTLRPKDVAAVVAFYGTRKENYGGAKAAFLGHFAEYDEYEPLGEVEELEKAIKSAGCRVTFHVYSKAQHWFFEENRPSTYDRRAAKLAWRRTVSFLHNYLD